MRSREDGEGDMLCIKNAQQRLKLEEGSWKKRQEL